MIRKFLLFVLILPALALADIIRVDVLSGPTEIPGSGGRVEGTIEFEWDDGVTLTRKIQAADLNAWANLLIDQPIAEQQQREEQDANNNIGDFEIEAVGEASQEQRAVAYLRSAMDQELAYDAYILLARFNNFRTNKGWSLAEVATRLMSAGYTQEEWDILRPAFQYLNGNNRPAVMAEARTIQENWEER